MPKRFTETLKWDDRWFRSLSPEFKLAWMYVLDKCDAAGVIEIDEELADFQIGVKVDWEGFRKATESRLESFSGRKFFIPKFIEFQYGSLSESCKPHKPIFASIRKYGLEERVSKGYPKGMDTLQEKEQEKDKDQDKEKDKDKDYVSSGPDHPLFRLDGFGATWTRWKRHRNEKLKPLGSMEEETQLMDLARAGPDEAIAIINFSIGKGALNLILNGDHKKQSQTRKATKF